MYDIYLHDSEDQAWKHEHWAVSQDVWQLKYNVCVCTRELYNQVKKGLAQMIQVKCGKGDAGVKLLGSRVSLSLNVGSEEYNWIVK